MPFNEIELENDNENIYKGRVIFIIADGGKITEFM